MKLIEARLRLATGLVLAAYVVQHLINHAFGIVSIEAAEAYRKTIGAVFQTLPGLILLYGSLAFHAAIALRALYRRSSLRMTAWQWAQLLLGLSILPLLAGHAIGNRGYDLLGDIDPDYFYVTTSMLLKPVFIVKIGLLLAVVWMHLVIGLHYWLRIKQGYRRYFYFGYAAALLIPVLAYVGSFNMLKQAATWLDDPARLEQIYAASNAMARRDVELLRALESQAWAGMAALLLAVVVARQLRIWWQARSGAYTIYHPEEDEIRALAGVSLLEALRNAGVPHASVCGGRARCTTCRVRVGPGRELLHPPNELEANALARIGAGGDVRLACQLHPRADLEITPLIEPGQTLGKTLRHAGGVQGHEEYVVAMFVDMRNSTRLGERVLAYDVVFILNRFFTELSTALRHSHGHYAQFAGDGLMALYGLEAERKPNACRDALAGARDMFERVGRLNEQLQSEFGEQISMGIGIHGGDAIVGTMGPPRTPLLTAVGDNINIAARLEAKTKDLGCDLIVSLETLERESIEVSPERVVEVDVRGRDSRVRVCLFGHEQLPGSDS